MDGEAEIIPGLLHLHFTQTPANPSPNIPAGSLYYWLDNDLIYEPFCADFGPCNLAHTWKFCQRVNHITQQAENDGKMAYLVVGPHPHKRANAAVLAGIYMVLYMDMKPDKAYQVMSEMGPFASFRDASCGAPSYTLGVLDVLRGMYRASKVGFINWHLGERFNVEEYEHFEQVENGDLNWIVPGKFLAFAGPAGQSKNFGGWRTFTPEDYVEYFTENNVTAVVRLNKKMYDGNRFRAHGINHHDLYFPDGTCPSDEILKRFLEIAETEPGALAVHCKAGLGRTGVLICCYMMKHYKFTAEEAMGYIRICRPGSVIGPQQHYLLHQYARIRQTTHVASWNAPNVCVENQTKPQVINIVATSRAIDLMNQHPLHHVAASSSYDEEASRIPARKVSPEELPPEKQSNVDQSNSFHIFVDASDNGAKPEFNENRILTPEKEQSFAPMPSLRPSPEKDLSSSLISMASATPETKRDGNIPPSSTKRVLAPNGQPRKIPLAVDFNQATMSGALEDKDCPDLVGRTSPKGSSFADEDDSDWSVGSQPVLDKNFNSNSRVGAFAAAAGRGANAFVDAFRSVLSAHRSSYKTTRGHE